MWITPVQILLGILLFYLVNWVGRHSYSYGYVQLSMYDQTDDSPAFNFFFRFGSPIVFILLVSSLFYAIGWDDYVGKIYWVVIYYFIFRFSFNILLERVLLINWFYEIFVALVTIFTSFILYTNLIVNKKNLIPDFTTLSNELWIIILVFIYTVLNKVNVSPDYADKRKIKFIKKTYQQFRDKYEDIINSKTQDDLIKSNIYAIMIYESFNRPKIIRFFENFLFAFGKSKTLGIMQVTTEERITDEESVSLGVDRVLTSYEKLLQSENELEYYQLTSMIIREYNPSHDYLVEVSSLQEIIFSLILSEKENIEEGKKN